MDWGKLLADASGADGFETSSNSDQASQPIGFVYQTSWILRAKLQFSFHAACCMGEVFA